MKKFVIISISILAQSNSFAMYTLVAARSLRTRPHASLPKPCPQRYSSSKEAFEKRYYELVGRYNDLCKSVVAMRREEKAFLLQIAENAGKFKSDFDSCERKRLKGECWCDNFNTSCECFNLHGELGFLDASIINLRRHRTSLFQEESKLRRLYYEISELKNKQK